MRSEQQRSGTEEADLVNQGAKLLRQGARIISIGSGWLVAVAVAAHVRCEHPVTGLDQ